MALESPVTLFSYDDYARLDDDRRYQVIEGELIPMTSPNRRHQDLLSRLHILLQPARQFGALYFAPLDVVLRAERPAVVVQPDLMFIGRDRLEVLTKANIQGAPNLVVEILSPSTAKLDAGRKRLLYAQYGVQEMWLILPEYDQIEVLRLTEAGAFTKPVVYEIGDVLTTPLMPGVELILADLFEDDEDEV